MLQTALPKNRRITDTITLPLPFSEKELDRKNYTASLLALCGNTGMISEETFRKITGDLDAAFTETAAQFTGRESSTISKQHAERIYGSVLYWADVYFLHLPSLSEAVQQLRTLPMHVILNRGRERILALHQENLTFYQNARRFRMNVSCYEYTYVMEHAFQEYQRHYSARFNARECGASIDYPLLDCPAYSLEQEGVMYINEYYRRIWLENEFCQYFNAAELESLLTAYGRLYGCPYGELLFNFAEVAANNLLANTMLGKTDFQLRLSAEEVQAITAKCAIFSQEAICRELSGRFAAYRSRFRHDAVYQYAADYIPAFTAYLCSRMALRDRLGNFLVITE